MIDLRQVVWRMFPVLLLAVSAGATELPAQAQRDSLVAKAVDEFDTGRQLQLLRAALDPAGGPPTGSWATGVQLLAQTLLQDKRDSLAATWLRWAVRLSPGLKPDTVQFLPFVATALRSAQEYVRRTSTPGDSLAKTSWVWPAQGTDEVTGKLQLSATGAVLPRTSISGGTPIKPGAPATLDPGSYEIHAAGEGYDSIAVTREVLPAVTTVVELKPRSVLAQAAKPPGPTPQPATPTMPPIELAKPHKKSTLLIVGLGVVGAGVAVAVLAGGGKGSSSTPPSTGGITLTFPNP